MNPPCPICAPLQDTTHERNPRKSPPDLFPDAANRLEASGDSGLSHCPCCGRWFRTTTHTEWDMFEEKMVEEERIFEISEREAQEIRGTASPNKEPVTGRIENPGRCPKCGGADLELLRETKVGDSILEWHRCRACRYEGFMDLHPDDEGQGWR